MNLDFRILWFDDQPDSMGISAEGIKTRLARLGFSLSIYSITQVRDLKSLVPMLNGQGKFDLIMLDWDMGKGASGDVVAKALRSEFHHTDMVFYSARTLHDLRTAIYEQGIDGVFCAQRDNLVVDTFNLIKSILKKVLDLNQMRGIMMAQVSDFDKKITNCLTAWHDRVDANEKSALIEQIKLTIKKTYDDGLKRLEEIDPDDEFSELVNMWSFSSALRARVLLKAIKPYSLDHTTEDSVSKLSRYEQEVLKPRNDLAHVIETHEKGKPVLKSGSTSYDEAMLTEIRRGLLEHSDNLDDLLASINSGLFVNAAE